MDPFNEKDKHVNQHNNLIFTNRKPSKSSEKEIKIRQPFNGIVILIIFFQVCKRAESSKSCNLIGSVSRRFFTILPANPAGILFFFFLN